MTVFSWISLSLALLSSFSPPSLGDGGHASSPPRGWNSYDSFTWTISEQEFLQNAQLVSDRLRPFGYEYVVVDYLWYRKNVTEANVDSLGYDVIDEWGRMVPDTVRWPSAGNGKGFTDVANKVHAMGLKFGIHIMSGISTQAFNANTTILDIDTGNAYEEDGRKWYAKDIGIKERACAWMKNGFMSVNTKLGAGRAFLRSLHQQYAAWGVDFVKHDCVFGADLDLDEITYVSGVLAELNHSIVYSLSPGTSVTPAMAQQVSGLVNMYRITGDDWDKWDDVASHFDITRDLSAANMTGTSGLNGKSWPDLDMLPLGWLSEAGSNEGPNRISNLTLDEQRTQVTLWAMAKSPLMFGGDMRNISNTTFDLITNPTILEINSYSSNNSEFTYISSPWSRNYPNGSRLEDSLSFGLTSCDDLEARSWSTRAVGDNSEQVCWKKKFGEVHDKESPFCLYKSAAHMSLGEDMMYRHNFDGKLHLSSTKLAETCLGASPSQRLTSSELKRGSFSPCSSHTNQMWELTSNGTLMNSYSGLCAFVRAAKVDSVSGGARAWIASGRGGKFYVAFFNLDQEKAQVSMRIGDLGKVLLGNDFESASCNCTEEWKQQELGIVKETLSAELEVHGVALFVLNCTFR